MPYMMRVSVLNKPGEIVVQERPVPEPGRNEVLVKVASVGVCGSDTHYFDHGRIGRFVVTAPLVLGHEVSGRVVGVGPEVDPARVGQRVAVEPGVPDFTCEQCLAGRYNLCPQMRFLATPPIDGAFAEYLLVHEAFAHPLPDAVSDDAGALLEPLSVAVWACHKAGIGAASSVLVTGAGPVGLLVTQVAVALGATSVTVTDVNARRLSVAAELGATRVVDMSERDSSATDSLRAHARDLGSHDALIECSGHASAVLTGLSSLKPAGTAVMVGMGSADVAIPVGLLQEKELTLTGTFRYASTWPTAIALAASGRVQLEPLVTGHFALDDVRAALTASGDDPSALKSMVVPGALAQPGEASTP